MLTHNQAGVPAWRRASYCGTGRYCIEVTVTNMQELEQALQAKVNVLRLENFPPGQVRQAIALVQGRAKVEITGKVGLDNARAYALAGVDFISVDQLTQSVKAFDFAFRVSR